MSRRGSSLALCRAGEFREEVRLAALIRDHDTAAVADFFGLDMLVGRRVLRQRRGVDAGLGGEGGRADIGAWAFGERLSSSSKARDRREMAGNPCSPMPVSKRSA